MLKKAENSSVALLVFWQVQKSYLVFQLEAQRLWVGTQQAPAYS